MAKHITGDMFDLLDIWKESGTPRFTKFAFTANSIITPAIPPRLVMGGGIAKEVKLAFPNIDARIAQELLARGYKSGDDFHWLPNKPNGLVAVLQTKRSYADPSPLPLVRESLRALYKWMQANGEYTVHLNYPAIGLGGLSKSDIQPMLNHFDDRLVVWELETTCTTYNVVLGCRCTHTICVKQLPQVMFCSKCGSIDEPITQSQRLDIAI